MRPKCIIDLYHVDQSDCFILPLILDTLCLLLIVHIVFEYMDQDLDSCIRHSLPRGLDEQIIKVSAFITGSHVIFYYNNIHSCLLSKCYLPFYYIWF